jgi:uncharacterized protein (DUF2062 family)
MRRYLTMRDEPPGRVAAALALGVAIGMTPLVGLQTVIAFTLAFALQLPRIHVWLATFVMNPWTIVPILAFEYWLGRALLGRAPGQEGLDWKAFAHGSFQRAFRSVGPSDLASLLVGGALVALPSGLAVYVLAVRGLRRLQSARSSVAPPGSGRQPADPKSRPARGRSSATGIHDPAAAPVPRCPQGHGGLTNSGTE